MPFRAKQFCTDHNIPTAPPGHRHGRVGWVNVACKIFLLTSQNKKVILNPE